jgi:hypothetical protein
MYRTLGHCGRSLRSTVVSTAALVLACISSPADATENGRNPFPNGLNASDIGNVPPKGFYLVNEFV